MIATLYSVQHFCVLSASTFLSSEECLYKYIDMENAENLLEFEFHVSQT